MKNIKVTYEYINPSRILGNLLVNNPENEKTISVFEYRNLSEEVATRIIGKLSEYPFVIDYKVVSNNGVELTKARDS